MNRQDDEDQPDTSVVRNEILGLVEGSVVQAGVVHGDVRIQIAAPELRLALQEVAAHLARAVRSQWQREEALRRVSDPYPLPMRWRRAPDETTDHWSNIRLAPAGVNAGPLPLETNEPGDIVKTYQVVPSRRLVVLGETGSGKTVLAIRFTLDFLTSRSVDDPVPVIFRLGTWNPGTTALNDWLVDQLIEDHPYLGTTGPDRLSLAATLVEAGYVLPVLDGFDEIANGQHEAALSALNITSTPVIITSRADEYVTAINKTDVLTAAAVIVLNRLTIEDLADYLPRTSRGQRWQGVLEHLRSYPDGLLGQVLATPLMVGLARSVYSDSPNRDPYELLSFEDRPELENHLLDAFVPAVYDLPPSGRRMRRHHHWSSQDAQRWLEILATHSTKKGNGDVAWWELREISSRWTQALVMGLAVGSLCGTVAGIANALLGGPRQGLEFGLILIITFMLPTAVATYISGLNLEPFRLQLQLHKRIISAIRRIAAASLVAVPVGYASIPKWGTHIGIVITLGTLLLAIKMSGQLPNSWSPRRVYNILRKHRTLSIRTDVFSATYGLLLYLVLWYEFNTLKAAFVSIGTVAFLALTLPSPKKISSKSIPANPSVETKVQSGWSAREARITLSGLLFGPLFTGANLVGWLLVKHTLAETSTQPVVDIGLSLEIGCTIALVHNAVNGLGQPTEVRDSVNQDALLAADRHNTAFQATATGFVIAAAIITLSLLGPSPTAMGVEVGAIFGFGVGLAVAMAGSAWGQWLVICRFWLPLTGQLPWALNDFLADAHRRGVLRQAGAVYQFRHNRLQDRLARVAELRHQQAIAQR